MPRADAAAHLISVGTTASQLTAAEAKSRRFVTYFDLLHICDDVALRETGEAASRVLTHARICQHLAQSSLASLGINRCDRVCAALPAGLGAATAFLTCVLHCVYAPLNSSLTAAELAVEMERLAAAAVVVCKRTAAKVRAAAGGCGLPTISMTETGDTRALDAFYRVEN